MPSKIDTVIRACLAKRRGKWTEIAQQANVSHSWISKFVNGLAAGFLLNI